MKLSMGAIETMKRRRKKETKGKVHGALTFKRRAKKGMPEAKTNPHTHKP